MSPSVITPFVSLFHCIDLSDCYSSYSHAVATCPYKKSIPCFPVDSDQVLEGCYEVPLGPFSSLAEKPQLS